MLNEIIIKRYRNNNKKGYVYDAHIYIDGISLIELVREVELPYAHAESNGGRAGAYTWLESDILYSNILNLQRNFNAEDQRATILACSCGEYFCWPFSVRILKDGDTIIWTDFEQAERSRESCNYWSYASLGPFIFDVKQYVGELPVYYKRYHPFRPF